MPMPQVNKQKGECLNVTLFTHTFICHLTVATNIAIYAVSETQIYTSGVYTNYYRGYKYPSSCPTNRYGPACLYECNCEPEYCHIVLGCTDTHQTKLSELSMNLCVHNFSYFGVIVFQFTSLRSYLPNITEEITPAPMLEI